MANHASISFSEPAILGKEREASGIIRCRKPGILAKTELRIPYQRPIRFLPETDYPRASRSFPRIAGSGNEIDHAYLIQLGIVITTQQKYHVFTDNIVESSTPTKKLSKKFH
jgi:hypothetical protein